jgi:DNA-binding SARP family transcriptional activator
VLEFRILGPLEVVEERGPIRLGGAKQRATLAILLLSANRVVSVDRLADDLYAGAAPVTALKQVQRQVSELRKALRLASAIETRSPGYAIRLAPAQLDLTIFERVAADGAEALAAGEAQRAAELLRRALGLWRGPPLADLSYESFAQAAIERLEEIRLAALEHRIEAELKIGRESELVGELEQLVAEHPLRERFRAQLMLALYRSGRQAEALEAYRRAREALVEGFGIEPTTVLQQLERQILVQDPALDARPAASERLEISAAGDRSVLVVAAAEDDLEPPLSLAEPLAASGRELIVARLIADERELGRAAAALNARCAALGGVARAAAFTSPDAPADVIRLATAYDVELVLLPAPDALDAATLPPDLAEVLERSAADIAVTSGAADWSAGAGVFVPFGGAEHDWAALELGAWLASAGNAPLRLLGTRADARSGRRDASRLLASASLAVQRLSGVTSEPLLIEASETALAASIEPATVVVAGISPRWRAEGIGASRRALVRRAGPPVVLVRGGLRPGGLAPAASRTGFTWSLVASS